MFGAIILLDEIEAHLCKNSYQHQEPLHYDVHCGYDVHAELLYSCWPHPQETHQLLVTKEITIYSHDH